MVDYFGLKHQKQIIDKVRHVISLWSVYSMSLDVNKNDFKLVEKVLQKKLK